MSRSKRIGKVGVAAAAALDHVRRAAAQVKPFASSAQAAAGRGVQNARLRGAASRARRPGRGRQRRAQGVGHAVLGSAATRARKAAAPTLAQAGRDLAPYAAVSAAAALFRSRSKPDLTAPAVTDTDSAAPAAEVSDEGARTSTDAGVDGQARTS
jgi:hypothetical protein